MLIWRSVHVARVTSLADRLGAVQQQLDLERAERIAVQAKLDRYLDQALGHAGKIAAPVMTEESMSRGSDNPATMVMRAMAVQEFAER